MAVAAGFRVQRVTLVAGVFTPVHAPVNASNVSIGNATDDDLEVHTCDDESEWRIVAAGWEYGIGNTRGWFYQQQQVAFWLKSAPGGTAVVTWVL